MLSRMRWCKCCHVMLMSLVLWNELTCNCSRNPSPKHKHKEKHKLWCRSHLALMSCFGIPFTLNEVLSTNNYRKLVFCRKYVSTWQRAWIHISAWVKNERSILCAKIAFCRSILWRKSYFKNSTFLQFHHHKCCTFNPMTRAFENLGSIQCMLIIKRFFSGQIYYLETGNL